jgi:hypothetical protein
VAFGPMLASFSQVSVVFEQENPLSLDYVTPAIGPVHFAHAGSCSALNARSSVGEEDRWPLIVVFECAIGLRFSRTLSRVLTRFRNGGECSTSEGS